MSLPPWTTSLHGHLSHSSVVGVVVRTVAIFVVVACTVLIFVVVGSVVVIFVMVACTVLTFVVVGSVVVIFAVVAFVVVAFLLVVCAVAASVVAARVVAQNSVTLFGCVAMSLSHRTMLSTPGLESAVACDLFTEANSEQTPRKSVGLN